MHLPVAVGDSVSSGSLLFEVKSDDPQLRLRSAAEALRYAEQMADTLSFAAACRAESTTRKCAHSV